MSPRLALIALMTLPLAACQGIELPGMPPQQQAPQAEGHKGPPGVSPLEAPIETGAAGTVVATADARTHATAAFSARGNEPFWAVDVAGKTALYKTPQNQKGRAVRVERLTFAGGVEYIGVLDGRPFTLTVRGTDCQDSMSGEKFPMTAQLKTAGGTRSGCAGPASAEVAQAVAAIRAPAPAAPKAAPARAASSGSAAPSARPAAPTRTAPPAPAAPAPAPESPAATTTTETPATTTPVTPAPATPAPVTTDTPATEVKPVTVPAPVLQLPATPPITGGETTGQDSADE